MSEIQVEVCFTDKLESVRVGGKKMEIPKAVKESPSRSGLNRLRAA